MMNRLLGLHDPQRTLLCHRLLAVLAHWNPLRAMIVQSMESIPSGHVKYRNWKEIQQNTRKKSKNSEDLIFFFVSLFSPTARQPGAICDRPKAARLSSDDLRVGFMGLWGAQK